MTVWLGALILSFSCVVDVFTLTIKARVPSNWVRCPHAQKESPCSKAFRVEISKMPQVLKGESLVVPTGGTGCSWPAKDRGGEPFCLQHSGKGKPAKAASRTRQRPQLSTSQAPSAQGRMLSHTTPARRLRSTQPEPEFTPSQSHMDLRCPR